MFDAFGDWFVETYLARPDSWLLGALTVWIILALLAHYMTISTKFSLSEQLLSEFSVELGQPTNDTSLSILQFVSRDALPGTCSPESENERCEWRVNEILAADWLFSLKKWAVIGSGILLFFSAIGVPLFEASTLKEGISLTNIQKGLNFVSFVPLFFLILISSLQVKLAVHKIPIDLIQKTKNWNVILFYY